MIAPSQEKCDEMRGFRALNGQELNTKVVQDNFIHLLSSKQQFSEIPKIPFDYPQNHNYLLGTRRSPNALKTS